MGGPLADQSLTFPMGASRILFFDARHVHDGADMPVAAINRDQGPHQHQHVDPVRLDAPCASVDLKTGGIEHAAVDAFRRQRPGQPKPVVTGLVADEQALVLRGGAQSHYEFGERAALDPGSVELSLAEEWRRPKFSC
jgi:hypothetical protein